MSGEDVEHVYTMVVVGPADRDMAYAMNRAMKYSEISWWTEGEKFIRPTLCSREGHNFNSWDYCDECGDEKEEEDESATA